MAYSLGMLQSHEGEMNTLLQRISDSFKLKKIEEFNAETVLKRNINKDVFVGFVGELVGLCLKSKNILKSAASEIDDLKSEQLRNQNQLIKVQEQLLQKKDDNIKSVGTSVKQELKSWSEVVKQSGGATISAKAVMEAVRSSSIEDMKNRCLMIFGEEEEEEKEREYDRVTTNDIVETLFEHINEKPLVLAAYRVGAKQDDKPRPIRVQLNSSDIVHVILRKAKKLKNIEVYRNTYLAPDRNKEERIKHKRLVDEMKKMIGQDTGKHFFIRDEKICSLEKTQSLSETSAH